MTLLLDKGLDPVCWVEGVLSCAGLLGMMDEGKEVLVPDRICSAGLISGDLEVQ